MKLLLDLQGMQSSSRHRGIGRQTTALALAMIEQSTDRHDVHVLWNETLGDLSPTADLILDRLPRDNVHGFATFKRGAGQTDFNPWRMESAALVREAVVARLRPDIVHLPSLFEGFVDEAVTSVARLIAPHATAVTFHDLIPLAAPEHYLADPVYKRFYLRQAQDLKRADRLLAVSEFSGREAERRLQIPPDRISVIGSGVSDEFRPLQLDAGAERSLRKRLGLARRIVLHVGAVDARKNVGLLIDAFGRLPRSVSSDRQLVFVGPISDGERDLIVSLGQGFGVAADAIVVPGLIAMDDLLALYRLADALVFPSTGEGFGLPALEAMACGLPVLAADATALPEVLGREDCLFDPGDAHQLTAKLERLLTQDSWWEELRAWGLTRAATFRWSSVGARALAALERTAEEHAARVPETRSLRRRPLMAFISPLPPDQTGIADFSAELLRELLVFYEIDCILPTPETNDEWIEANCRLRSVEWFKAHADRYDRIVYSIGNSTFHAHMFELLVRFPGTVILHDGFLSDLAFHLAAGHLTAALRKEIYLSHGLTGLRLLHDEGPGAAIAKLTMSGSVFRNAQGIIVHSHYALSLARRAFGPEVERDLLVVPLLRSLPVQPNRAAARERLGLAADEFVVCSFGIVHPNKSNGLLAEAFIRSELADDPACVLLFVGQDVIAYGQDLAEAVVRPAHVAGQVRFIGRVDEDVYRDYLAAADVAVQLRTQSRGETSGAVLDAMAYGLPTVVSDLGSAAELPDEAVIKLPIGSGPDVLSEILNRLRLDRSHRERIGEAARAQIKHCHSPAVVTRDIRRFVDHVATTGGRGTSGELFAALSDIREGPIPARDDLVALARQIRSLSPAPRFRQILCDVSVLADEDARTGIQRVVRAVLEQLIADPPAGYRIEPVIISEHGYLHARRFAAERLGLSTGHDVDEPVEFGSGDQFLGLDWVPDRLPAQAGWLERFRRAGGTVTFVVYDLLPLEQPGFFPDWMKELDERWLATVVRTSDRLACISAATADSVAAFARPMLDRKRHPLRIGFFHLGHDLAASRPTAGLPEDAAELLSALQGRPTFLMVGTVEPRKGHDQVVAAFERLWAEGADVGLCIVGKEGWMVADLAGAIRESGEFGRRLVWLPRASDELLERVYRTVVALIAASRGEGFGLPLIEAAEHGVPVIARDLPVFREVGGAHAFYFQGIQAEDLASAIRRWLELQARSEVPSSAGMPRLTWREATRDLTAIMLGERTYRVLDRDTLGIDEDLASAETEAGRR